MSVYFGLEGNGLLRPRIVFSSPQQQYSTPSSRNAPLPNIRQLYIIIMVHITSAMFRGFCVALEVFCVMGCEAGCG